METNAPVTQEETINPKKRPFSEVDKKEEEEENDTTTSAASSSSETQKQKFLKKKVAIIFGYNGDRYFGLQTQHGKFLAIEDVLFKALATCGCISESNAVAYHKVGWARCSRTDKKVHAAINAVQLKMLLNVPTEQEWTDKMNKILAEQFNASDIHIYGYKRVTASFHVKNHCDGRVYEYLIPTYAFAQKSDIKILQEKYQIELDPKKTLDTFFAKQSQETILELLQQHNQVDKLQNYRISQEAVTEIRSWLAKYKGTHSFHNFTKRNRGYSKGALLRVIRDFVASDPVVISGIEYMVLTVTGASFMIHQIRKMVGMVVALVSKLVEPSEFETALDKKNNSYETPMIPGVGLLLLKPLFTNYNKNKGDVHGNLDFEEYAQDINSFKHTLHEFIVKSEVESQIIGKWCVETHFKQQLFKDKKLNMQDLELEEEGEQTVDDDMA